MAAGGAAEVAAERVGLDPIDAWEARAERDVGLMIARYLGENPCPGASRICDAFASYAAQLRDRGEARLEAGSVRAFRAVASD